ncbi:hypothetical protein CPB86DRAFT_871288 [Serendipita vermifera]|nr:hypothetical protein CPB86DRAFT_871288 [Serendipita vermifera]
MDHDLALSDLGDMFPEPSRPATPPATVEVYSRAVDDRSRGPNEVKIHLVGQHPLWGHHLWNAAKCLANFLDTHWETLCRNKRILELGAGGGLPALVAAMNQANSVVLTDYPDPNLVRNLLANVEENLTGELLQRTKVTGFIWGSAPTELLLDGEFDVILLSDLLFNHSQHDALLRTCDQVLSRPTQNMARKPGKLEANSPMTPCVLVFFTHHRPWLAKKDLEFFDKAKNSGWSCDEIVQIHTGAMFKDDAGDESIRGTVHGWRMWREGS